MRVELHLELAWGAAAQEVGAEVQRRVADYLERMAGARPTAVDVVVDEIGRMSVRIAGLTGATLEHAPTVCHDCIWWQSRTGGRERDKHRWIEKAEDELGAWGTIYYDDDGRTARLDAVRAGAALPARRRAARGPAVGRRRARHVRVPRRPLEPVGDAVALPRRDRRGEGQGRGGARDVRVPLPRGRVRLRALPRPPHGLPARLPRRLRLPDDPLLRAASSWRGSSSAGSCPSSRASARRCCER